MRTRCGSAYIPGGPSCAPCFMSLFFLSAGEASCITRGVFKWTRVCITCDIGLLINRGDEIHLCRRRRAAIITKTWANHAAT
jgi:hypothetical protein